MSDYPDTILFMECESCGFTTTTSADNTLVATGGFTCPNEGEVMDSQAKYQKVDVKQKNDEGENQ